MTNDTQKRILSFVEQRIRFFSGKGNAEAVTRLKSLKQVLDPSWVDDEDELPF